MSRKPTRSAATSAATSAIHLLPQLLLQLFIYLSTSSVHNNLFEIQCTGLCSMHRPSALPWELQRPFGAALFTLNLHAACVLLFDFDDSFLEPP